MKWKLQDQEKNLSGVKSEIIFNEKVIPYIAFFQLCYTNSPYPAYEILRPYLPYIEALWEEIEPVEGCLWLFLAFSDTEYHLRKSGARIVG
jgi:hypothetical protein